jgi:D-alanyl-D-alanine dipeptidase
MAKARSRVTETAKAVYRALGCRGLARVDMFLTEDGGVVLNEVNSRQPEDGRTKRKHYPNIDRSEMLERGYVAAKSSHSRGGAIDLTLYRLSDGALVPMGGGFDLMDPISHHGAKGIAPAEAKNRRCLRFVMEACGFASYDPEWWHYALKREPYPDTYFDFPVA